MKYTLLITLCCLSLYSFVQSNTNNITANVKTSFKGRHCRGTHGLCNMDTNVRAVDTNTDIIYDGISNNIILHIQRSKLSQEEQLHITRGDIQNDASTQKYYLMEDDFIIPNTIIQQLQIGIEDITIHKGIYPLVVSENTIIITFNLE